MNQNIKFKEKTIICTDFDKDLRLYDLPKDIRLKINKSKNLKIINFSFNNPLCKKSTIYWGNLIDDEKIKFLENLRWIHLGCVGHDKIKNLKLLSSIKLTNSSKIMSDAVSESIICFIFIFLRRFDRCVSLRKNKKLNRENFDKFFDQIKVIKECKFLIFGGGDISKNLISKLKHFSDNITLVSSKPFLSKSVRNYLFRNFKKESLNYDFVISILPDKIKYHNFFDYKFFNSMNNNAYFINVGRGSVVNELDLISCLSKKKIGGAALDVFKDEPLNSKNPLLKFSNCLVTPHISGLFNNYWQKQDELFFYNLKSFLHGKKLKNQVNLKLSK